MVCVAVFGRGPDNGTVTNDHLKMIKNNPEILRDIYIISGITPFVPVSIGLENFKYGSAFPEHTFVCLEPTCRRKLPVYVAQIDHNVPQSGLSGVTPLLASLGNAMVAPENFTHRSSTDAKQHTHYAFQPNPLPSIIFSFQIYYTFRDDKFVLVMEGIDSHTGAKKMWHRDYPRAEAIELYALLLHKFTLKNTAYGYILVCNGKESGYLFETSTDYKKNQLPASDLGNYQLLCGPCNATKNNAGNPIAQTMVI